MCGLRAVPDSDYAFQLMVVNCPLMPDVETVLLTPSDKYQFVSSTFVGGIALLGGEGEKFVSRSVHARLMDKFKSLPKD